MNRLRVLGLALSLSCAALTSAPHAWSQQVDDATRNTARSLAGEGKDAFDAKNYARAFDLFHRAYALVPAPTIALYEAQSLIKLGRLVEAEEAYMRAIRTTLDAHSSEQFRAAVQDAERELAELQPRLPKATIVITGPAAGSTDVQVTLDGKPLPPAMVGVGIPVDPGRHVLRAVASGGEPSEVSFEISEKEQRRLEIAPVPGEVAAPPPVVRADTAPPDVAPKPQRPWQKPLGIAVGSVGVAGLATGIVTGLMAGSRHATVERDCPGKVCTEGSAAADALESFRTLRTVSTIGYVVGGVGLAAGAALLLTAPPSSSQSARSVEVWVTAGGVSVQGAF